MFILSSVLHAESCFFVRKHEQGLVVTNDLGHVVLSNVSSIKHQQKSLFPIYTSSNSKIELVKEIGTYGSEGYLTFKKLNNNSLSRKLFIISMDSFNSAMITPDILMTIEGKSSIEFRTTSGGAAQTTLRKIGTGGLYPAMFYLRGSVMSFKISRGVVKPCGNLPTPIELKSDA
jgi:hypothetical protein